MDKIGKPVEIVSKALGYVGLGLALLMGLFTTTDVLLRTFLNHPILGGVELVQLTMAATMSTLLAYATLYKKHIVIDALTMKLNAGTQKTLELFNTLLMAILMGVLAWFNLGETSGVIDSGVTTGILGIPDWPFRILMSICFAITFLVLVMQFAKQSIEYLQSLSSVRNP